MKKFITLFLAAGLIFGAVTTASAIDFRAKGQWIMSFDYGQGMSGYSDTRGGNNVYGSGYGDPSEDMFEARQRIRLQLDAVASEALSGTVYFEIGDTIWGKADEGGALGTDGSIVEVKNAYIDWIIPDTDLKVRMGLQGLNLPSYPSGGSQIFSDDVAGIVVSNVFTENVTLTAFWARPYNDNFEGFTRTTNGRDESANYLDNVDFFGLLLPMTFDGVKMTPWVSYTAVGENFARSWDNDDNLGNAFDEVYTGLFPAGMQGAYVGNTLGNHDLYDYGSVYHVGFTGEVNTWTPWRFAWDFNYGNAQFGEDYLQREGFFGSLLVEYRTDWGIPGLYGWYSTGDDGDIKNGSERMPTMSTDNNEIDFSNFAFTGNPYISREGIVGNTLVGTWGIGARVKDFSFMEDLMHTFRINYFMGTNSTEMAQYLRGDKTTSVADFSLSSTTGAAFATPSGIYMTTEDTALEFGFTTVYNMYENFEIMLDANYLALWMDKSNDVWGSDFSATDAWNINASFVYSF